MVAALFVRADSVYKGMQGVDAWDMQRDARQWPGGAAVVAHPPCRAWGRLRIHAKPRPDERALGPWAVEQVRRWGGVLGHPESSELFLYCGCPPPGARDEWGGHVVPIVQSWWGHRAEKATWLYVVGAGPMDLPPMPLDLARPSHVVCQRTGHRKGMPGWRPEITMAEREHTPPALAAWLVEVARRCGDAMGYRAAA